MLPPRYKLQKMRDWGKHFENTITQEKTVTSFEPQNDHTGKNKSDNNRQPTENGNYCF